MGVGVGGGDRGRVGGKEVEKVEGGWGWVVG